MERFIGIMIGILALALPSLALDIPEGAIVKTADNPDVYIIKHIGGKDYKRLILNPQVFRSYGHLRWENLITIDQASMDSFLTSELVRVDGTDAIYRLAPDGDSGSKLLVEDTNGLDLGSVYTINETDFQNYTELARLAGPYEVNRVIDGDTLVVDISGADRTVRLIGIDTPEISGPYTAAECYGGEATAAAQTKLAGKKIYLKTDSASGDQDKYGRLLRYVFLANGENFNQWMISEGNAREYTYNSISYEYQAAFRSAQSAAAALKKGLWSIEVCALGQPAAASGTYICSSNSYDCSSFNSQAEAQAAYMYCLQQTGTDVHRLDSDQDGIVCESLS